MTPSRELPNGTATTVTLVHVPSLPSDWGLASVTRRRGDDESARASRRALGEARAAVGDRPDPTDAQLSALARGELAPADAAELRRLLALRPPQFVRYVDVRLALGLPAIAEADLPAMESAGPEAPSTDWGSMVLSLQPVAPPEGATRPPTERVRQVLALGRKEEWEVRLTRELDALFLHLVRAGAPAGGVQAILLLYDAAGRERLERDGVTTEGGVAALGSAHGVETAPPGGELFVTLRWRDR